MRTETSATTQPDLSAAALRVFPRHLLPAKREEIARRAAQIAWVTTKHFTPLAIFQEFSPEEYLALVIGTRPREQQLTLF